MFINREIFAFIMVLLLMGIVGQVSAQESIGGPYTPDSATVLLMHFNDNFKNASNQYEIASPETYGNLSFLEMNGAGDLGYQVQFDNDSPEDKSHIQIPDTTALDLTGSWTIEYWLNTFTSGIVGIGDWRTKQTPIIKPGDGGPNNESGYAKANYLSRVPMDTRDFIAGYYNNQNDNRIALQSKSNLLRVGEWYHVTFIRDTSKQVIVQMIHQNGDNRGRLPYANDDSLRMIYFEAKYYGDEEVDAKPRTSDQPLFIGTTPEEDTLTGSLDGFMDELRISNVARNFAMPPAITQASKLNNQAAGEPSRIEARIDALGSASLTRTRLHYKAGPQPWQTVDMMQESEDIYAAQIPGQSVGTNVKYWISATSSHGMTATRPTRGYEDTTYYQYAAWEDSSQVLDLTFEGAEDGQPPEDQSIYKNAFSVTGQPTYPSVEGRGQVLDLSGEQGTSVATDAGVLSLGKFAIDLKFQANDSLPEPGNRLLIKEGADSPWPANYEIWFSGGGHLTVTPNVPDLTYGGPFAFKTITDTTIQPDHWYRLWFTYQPDTIRARLFSLRDNSYIGGFSEAMLTDNYAATTHGPFRVGAAGGDEYQDPENWFRGQVDDIRVYNYVPEYFKRTFTSVPERPDLPNQVKLKQNYPNPFNPSTRIAFSLPEGMQVELGVYDALGRRIQTLVDGYRKEGPHTVTFNAGGLASGVYFYRLETEDEVKSRRMLLVK